MSTDNVGAEPPNRMLAAWLGVLTLLVLLVAACILATDVVSRFDGNHAPSTSTSRPAADGVMPGMTFLEKSVLIAGSIVALGVVGPVVGAVCLFALLRRYAKQVGPLIHVEYTMPAPVHDCGRPVGASGVVEASTALPLNLGPSFEEERLRGAERARGRDAAVLAQLFEDNLKLKERIELAREKEKPMVAEHGGARVPPRAIRPPQVKS